MTTIDIDARSWGGRSPGRFAWLFAPEPDAPAAPGPDEFHAACAWALGEWQVLPAVAPALFAWAGPELCDGEPLVERVRDRVTSLTVLAGLQLTLNRRLVEEYERQQIPHAQLKGAAVRFSAYADPRQRVGKDIDLAVPRSHVRVAEEIAHAQGFIAAQWSPRQRIFRRADRRLRDAVEAEHYELGFLARRLTPEDLDPEDAAAIKRDLPHQYIWHDSPQGLACYVTLDLHHGLNLDVTVDDLVRDAVTQQLDGWTVRLPTPAWQLFHLVYKIYWEGVHAYRTGGYQFADLARVVPLIDGDDVDELRTTLSRLRMQAAGHYVLRRLLTDVRIAVPDHLIEYIRATAEASTDRSPHQSNDLGDMWPRLWGHL